MKSKAIFNLAFINGQYPKDGEMKNSYHSVGAAFLRDYEGKDIFSIKLESYPPIGKNVYAFEKVEEGKQAVLNTSVNKIFTVSVPKGTYADGNTKKTSYHKVGTAYLSDKGLNFRLDSLPFVNNNGELWLNLFENVKKEETPTAMNPNSMPVDNPSDAFDSQIEPEDV